MMKEAIASHVFHHSLLKCQVVDGTTSQPLGQLSEVWIDLNYHQVLGFKCCAGLWDFNPSIYSLRQILRMDHQQVTVDSTMAAHPTLMWGFNQKHSMAVGDRIRLEVWTQRGKWLGNVIDFTFNLESGNISSYLGSKTTTHASTKAEFRVPTDTIIDAGLGWLLVSDPATQSLDLEVEQRWFSPPLLNAV